MKHTSITWGSLTNTVTAKCKLSGFEFEAVSKRFAIHPKIRALKDEAVQFGDYGKVKVAIDEVRAAGGYEDIDEFIARVSASAGIKATLNQCWKCGSKLLNISQDNCKSCGTILN